jgi:hypothetical protein
MKHPALPAQRGIHVVGTQARNVQNNGPHLCTYHAALKSQELEENGSIAYDISNTRYQLPCPSRASRRWLVVLALTLHVFHAQTDLQGPTLEQYKPDAASMVFLGRSLVPWVNLSHDSMRDSSAVLIVLKHLS